MKIRLDLNEMPKPPPDEVISPVKNCINNINRYTPRNEVDKLVELLANYTKAPKDSIILSSGSDILIKEFIFLFSKGRQIIIADPTFFLIANATQKTTSPVLKIRLREPEFKLSVEPLINELKKPTLMVIDNPNNPTGSLLLSEREIKMVLENENAMLLVDEAYFEFSKITCAHMIKDYPNLAVSRTLSKSFGLAGSGIGYLIAGELVQKKFHGLDIMLPYPSVTAGIHALENMGYVQKFSEEVEQEKKRVMNYVSKMGISVYSSYANFLLMKTGIFGISQMLAEQDILVHDVSNQLSSEYIRVAIGTKDENDYFLNAIKNIMKSR